jgi:Fic family protein
MKRTTQGHYEITSTSSETVKAFVPAPLPPTPPIAWTPDLRGKFDEALLALGRLDSVSTLLPDVSTFLYTYVRKEAVLSSMIEGTRSSLSDLLLFEMNEQPGVPLDDVKEVSNYVNALDYGLERLQSGFPVSLRLIREIHAKLLESGARGADKKPGTFRQSQNWIGGTRPGNAFYVPPPAHLVLECMGKLELFLHDQPERTPILLKAALAHVQFESIHPFLDGNGRVGRLLITLLLVSSGALKLPMLYLSLYFKTHRQAYYDFLNKVRLDGDWEAWLDFFADAVRVTAGQAVDTVRRLDALSQQDRAKIQQLGRAAGSALRVHHELLCRPICDGNRLKESTGLTLATVNKSLDHLCELGLTKEMTGKQRYRIFCYPAYIDILNEGTDLPIGGAD